MRVADTALWARRTQQECSARRELGGSIITAWAVTCPESLSTCHYDCNASPACELSLEPVVVSTLAQGTWLSLPVPLPWVALSLLFTEAIDACHVVDCANQASSEPYLSQA